MATYLYLSLSIRAVATISILAVAATRFAIIVYQKKISPLSKLVLDLAIALITTMLFFLSYLGPNMVALSLAPQDPIFTIFRGLLTILFIITVGLFYTIVAWLPLGILNYLMLKKILPSRPLKTPKK